VHKIEFRKTAINNKTKKNMYNTKFVYSPRQWAIWSFTKPLCAYLDLGLLDAPYLSQTRITLFTRELYRVSELQQYCY